MKLRISIRMVVATAVLGGCGSCGSNNKMTTPSGDSGDSGDSALPGVDARLGTGEAGGQVTYVAGNSVFQIAAIDGATPVSLDTRLNTLSPGAGGSKPAVSKNGAFITISTEGFDPQCNGYACVALLTGDVSAGEVVYVGGDPLRSEGRVAVSNDGKTLALEGDGPHSEDIVVTHKSGNSWSALEVLTTASPHEFNNAPVLSAAGDTVLFDCGPVPYGQAGTGVCEVGIDGTGFRQVIDPAKSPLGNGSDSNQARHGDYTPDGGIVFEADWSAEQVWWQAPGSSSAVRIIASQSNDNSPCALPGGYIASLWLGRPEGSGEHELKITAPDGSEFAVITPNVDIADIGISCHEIYKP